MLVSCCLVCWEMSWEWEWLLGYCFFFDSFIGVISLLVFVFFLFFVFGIFKGSTLDVLNGLSVNLFLFFYLSLTQVE
jgi:hypothetical protein